MIQITTTQSQGTTYPVDLVSGSGQVTCRLVGAPGGVTIDAAREISVPAGLQPADYLFQVICSNACDGDSEPMDIRLTVQQDVIIQPPQGCENINVQPPASRQRIFASPQSPIVVPDTFVGIHANQDIPNWGGGGSIPAPLIPYETVRILAGTGTRSTGEVVEEVGFWRNVELSPGVYEWSAVDDWMGDVVQGRDVSYVFYGPPEFYQKYPGEPSRWPSWPGVGSPPLDSALPAATAFIQALVARYPNIKRIQVSNEALFNWNTPVTEYGPAGRASPAFVSANIAAGSSFFTGSATDLANWVGATKEGAGGVPVSFAGFENPSNNVVARSVNAPVTIGAYAGQLAGAIADEFDGHSYDFDGVMMGLVQEIDAYKAGVAAFGNKPFRLSEGGRWIGSEPVQDLGAWYLIAALQGLSGASAYGHLWADDARGHFDNGINSPEIIALMNKMASLNGATICDGAILSNNTAWAVLSTGEVFNYGG